MWQMEKQDMVVTWIGGKSTNQDVTIRLVPNGVTVKPNLKQTLGVMKVHSKVLVKYSKYFNTCLSERWMKLGSNSSQVEYILEVQADAACYFDCLSRMYSVPFLKPESGDTKYSLGLLKVASQIEFHELMDSISRHLSSKYWSNEEDAMIKEYASSPDFPRDHAEDLAVRLGLDQTEEDCQQQSLDTIQHFVRAALRHDGKSESIRAFLIEVLENVKSETPSNLHAIVVMLVTSEAKDMFVNVSKECQGRMFHHVPELKDKLETMCWVLKALMAAKVAAQLVECFAHLDSLSQALSPRLLSRNELQLPGFGALVKLVLLMYQEVVAGNLLLRAPERLALLVNWHSFMKALLKKEVYCEATKQLLSTLPLKQQMEFIKLRIHHFDEFICTSSLISTLSKSCNWPAPPKLGS